MGYNGSVAAQKVRLNISKALVRGIAIAVLAIIVATVLSYAILLVLPFSPLHKVADFMKLNNQNPVAAQTSYVRGLNKSVDTLDVFLVTPLAALISGLAFAYSMPITGWPVPRLLKTSCILGFVVMFGVLLVTLGFDQIIQLMENQTVSQFDPSRLPIGILQSFIYDIPFVLGSWFGAVKRKTKDVSKAAVPTSSARKQPA
jgi:hypothetical protein